DDQEQQDGPVLGQHASVYPSRESMRFSHANARRGNRAFLLIVIPDTAQPRSGQIRPERIWTTEGWPGGQSPWTGFAIQLLLLTPVSARRTLRSPTPETNHAHRIPFRTARNRPAAAVPASARGRRHAGRHLDAGGRR